MHCERFSTFTSTAFSIRYSFIFKYMKDFQLIAIFTFPSEYTVLQHLLQQANLRFIFQNETMVSVLPFHSNAVGGIRLLVHQNDIAEATEILNNLNNPSDLRIV